MIIFIIIVVAIITVVANTPGLILGLIGDFVCRDYDTKIERFF